MKLALAILALIIAPLTASAMTTTPCALDSPDVTDNVQNNVGCLTFDGFANLDSDFVTAAGTVVDFLEKDNSEDFGSGGELTISGTTLAGDWSINNFVSDMIYLLVFKDGTNADPANQVGYFVTEDSGTYSSPFYNSPGGSQKDISFVSLFKVNGDCVSTDCPGGTGVNPIPLPASGLLLLAPLLWMARRRG